MADGDGGRPVAVEVLAPAKINLTLHVVGRRPDGYHLLDSLVVFADLGDTLRLRSAARTSLSVTGPFAAAVPQGDDNLVLRAARLCGAKVQVALHKDLPVGGGIGGGSSDAAAVLRAVTAMSGRPLPDALPLGADVPVCAAARPVRMQGVGERLEPLPRLPELPMVLVNPGAAVSTAEIFSTLDRSDNPPMPAAVPPWRNVAEAAQWLGRQRNDLEDAAVRRAPVIAEARAALQAAGRCLLARMSGSGSTVFGLFPDPAAAQGAAERVAAAHPGWWVRPTSALAKAPPVQERRLTT